MSDRTCTRCNADCHAEVLELRRQLAGVQIEWANSRFALEEAHQDLRVAKTEAFAEAERAMVLERQLAASKLIEQQFTKRYRDDYDRMLALWGELWRLGACTLDAPGGGLAHQVIDRGAAEVLRLQQENADLRRKMRYYDRVHLGGNVTLRAFVTHALMRIIELDARPSRANVRLMVQEAEGALRALQADNPDAVPERAT